MGGVVVPEQVRGLDPPSRHEPVVQSRIVADDGPLLVMAEGPICGREREVCVLLKPAVHWDETAEGGDGDHYQSGLDG